MVPEAVNPDAGAPEPADRGPETPRRARAPRIPGYRLEGVIGRGATGVVYRAVQLAVDRPVALKVLHPDLVGTRAVGRLQREARTTARLAHPGIVSAIDMGQVGGLWWYAMELVDGRSLAAILAERGALGPREALRLFLPLCEALQHAYEHGVVHRDVKPGNILVDRSLRARLVDLGLAFTEEDPRLTSTGGTLGTPFYISPEQARDPGAADVRSDIWSLGASLFHAVCGRPPFQGDSVAEILSGVLYSRIPDPRALEPRVSRDLALVLRKCLAREPGDRYQEPRELLEDLERLVERRPVLVEASELDPLLGQRDRSRALWIGGIAVLVLAVAGALAWRARSGDGEPAPPVVAAEPYGPLEELAARLDAGELLPGPALAAVERLSDEVPPRAQERLAEVRALAHRDYNQALRAFQRRVRDEMDALLGTRRDHVAARAYLDQELGEQLQLDLGLGERRLREELDSDWVAEHRARVETSQAAALEGLARSAEQLYEGAVLPRVEALLDRQRWVDAHAALGDGPAEWLAEAGIATAGLPAAARDAALAPVAERARARRREVESDWGELDGRLAEFLDDESERLTNLLHQREAPADVGAELDRAFRARLAELGLQEDQALRAAGELAWSSLAVLRPGLDELQRELHVRDAEAWLAREEQALAPAYARRDYRAAAEAWSAALARGWPEPVQGRIRARRDEAELLVGLLERAARGVLELSGRQASFFVGSIAATGVVDVRGDPLASGFDLRTSAAGAAGRGAPLGAHRLLLRAPSEEARAQLVLLADLERLAGLPEGSADLQPAERVARAALRLYEGDVEAAAAVLAAGPTTGLGDLAGDLRRRISLESRGRAALESERQAAAERLYNLVKREARRERSHRRDVEQALAMVEELLRDYVDLDFVREREAELREVRRALAPAEAAPEFDEELARLYAPDDAARLPGGNLRLTYAFDGSSASRAWTRGDWRPDGLGWSAPALRTREDLALDTRWPRLVLGPPLDLGPGVLDVRVEFEQLEASGPPRLLIASVAGVHVALAGGEGARPPRWSLASGRAGLEALVAEVPDGAGEPFAGLRRGERHELLVRLRRGRGRVEVELDGETLGARTLHPPAPGEPGSASIVLRSLEPVRLLRVELVTPVP